MLEIELIQVTFGVRDSLSRVPSEKEWDALFAFAERHSLLGVLFDGVEKLPQEQMPYIDLLMEWVGQAQYQQQDYNEQRSAVESLVKLWKSEGVQVTELKGDSIGRYYPNPAMRYSCDFDCLLSDYEKGNRIVEAQGVKVNRDFYKNSSFVWNGVHVENHQFCTPVRGNREMKRLERVLRDVLDKGDRATFDALFLMEHMWAHFFEEALTMKQVCDWVVFRQKFGGGACGEGAVAEQVEAGEVDWALFEREAKACGFWRFAVAMDKIAGAILEMREERLEMREEERRLWECVLDGGGSIEMNRGWRTRVQMVRNFFRNGWKYRYFHNHLAMYVLGRTVWAFVFDRNPRI